MADENRNKNWGENQNTKPTLRMPGLFRNIDRARLMKGELGSLYIPEHFLPTFQFFPLQCCRLSSLAPLCNCTHFRIFQLLMMCICIDQSQFPQESLQGADKSIQLGIDSFKFWRTILQETGHLRAPLCFNFLFYWFFFVVFLFLCVSIFYSPLPTLSTHLSLCTEV